MKSHGVFRSPQGFFESLEAPSGLLKSLEVLFSLVKPLKAPWSLVSQVKSFDLLSCLMKSRSFFWSQTKS
jgi:hypothetical protein